jgi:nucleoside-diphosphate-sugar epimerase
MTEAAHVPPYPAELSASPTTVAVTGCAGYVAAAIVARLLLLGHTVHGTCRDPSPATVQALKVRSRVLNPLWRVTGSSTLVKVLIS